jgi:tetratricopeptide (TPR) repeat protein
MKKATYDKASLRHTIITALGITVLAFLILVSIASAAQASNVPNSGGYFAKNFFEKKIKIQDEALLINPQNDKALVAKGNALSALNKNDEALVAYDKAIEINPNNLEAWSDKGIVLSQLGKYDEAQKAWDKAKPKDSDVFWRNKANDLYNSGQFAEANKALDKQIETHPYDAQAWNLKGGILGGSDEGNKASERASWIWNNRLENPL